MSGPRLELIAPHNEPVLLFRRAFRAPATLVFRAWTEPEHLRHWRVPHGFELVVCDVDLRVGGGYRFVHRAPDGSQHAFVAADAGAERGLAECHERLDELLAAMAPPPREGHRR